MNIGSSPSTPFGPRSAACASPGGWPDRPAASERERAFRRRARRPGVSSAAASPLPTALSPKEARLEAALFVAGGPVRPARLAQHATLADVAEVKRLIARLNARYDQVRAAFRIEQVASGYVLMTRPVFAFWLDRVHQRQAELKLTPPQLETLTIIAYRQPITRADVEAVRGVQCAEMLKQLMERGLVRIGGEDESLGRPYLYVTTRKFLEMYGVRSLDELPSADALRRPASARTLAADEADDADEPAAAA